MDRNRFAITAVIGCAALVVLLVVAIPAAFLIPSARLQVFGRNPAGAVTGPAGAGAQGVPDTGSENPNPDPAITADAALPSLVDLYQQNSAGVVSIRRPGQASSQANGAGFILDEAGHILTAAHLAAEAEELTVIFHNGFEARARVIGSDAGSGLAVLLAEALVEGAHPLTLGDSDALQVGEWVVALGNPSGASSSMTAGIVSALGQQFTSPQAAFSLPLGIQIQNAIHSGNTGGPLLNLQGEVIAINAQLSEIDGQTGPAVGYALPASVVRHVVPVLIEKGAYEWPWLGLSGEPVNLEIAEANRLPHQQGAYVTWVVPGSPAAKAGLIGRQNPEGGDIILAADGERVEHFTGLLALILFKNPGDRVILWISRAGEQLEVPLILEPRPEGIGAETY